MMENENTNQLELRICEHYHYRSQGFVIISIDGNKIQLRSLLQRKNICFQSYETLALAYRRGIFYKIQEAPLLAEVNKIIAALSTKVREQLDKRLEYVRRVLEKFEGSLPRQETTTFLAEIGKIIGDASPPGYTTIYNWVRTYLHAGENPTSLISMRVRKRKYRLTRQPEEIQEQINYNIELLYHSSTPCPVKAVIEAIEFSIEDLNSKRPISDQLQVPSRSTLRRIINEIDTFLTESHQLGHGAAIKNQRWSRVYRKLRRRLQRVECDTHVLDLIVVNEHGEVLGRPYLTIALDVYSRRVIGWDISLNPPSIEKTIRAIKMSLSSAYERNGLAEHYIVDNGAEFIAKKLQDCLRLLGAEITFCEPGEPNQKPFVERWFKTLTISLIHHMKGTTFSNILERGDYDSEKDAVFTLGQLSETFKDWLDTVYHSDFHRGLGTSPDIFWNTHTDNAFPPKRYSHEDLNRFFLSKRSALPANGRIGFQDLQWTGPAVAYLSTLKGNKDKLTLFYDPSELGTAWVCHPDTPDELFSIEAADPDYQIGLTMHMHKLIRKELQEKHSKFNYKDARNNRVRINLRLAAAKGKRARKQQARMAENGSYSPPLPLASTPSETNETFMIDPSKHLANSQVPGLSQVIGAKHDKHNGES
ncbi:Integrase core domain protein [compost metagenome]